jgi:hypothetical protein
MNDCRPGQPRTVGDVEIEPIERVVVRVEKAFGGIAAVAFKEPIAVVIRSPAGTWRVELASHVDRRSEPDDATTWRGVGVQDQLPRDT